jgi:hypothetical protein
MKVTVADAAKKLGMSAQGLRIAVQRGRFSQFGVAWKNEQKWSYYINRARLEQYLKAEGVNDELYIGT